MAKRIGPQMTRVVEYVKAHPACCKKRPAVLVAPYGSEAACHFGYRVVNRCIAAGLITATRLNNGTYQLFITE
jgi:hypothetical protein